MKNHPQEEFMKKAIEEAKKAVSLGQYAIAAVIIGPDGQVVSVAHTTIFETNDATAHAEINAIRAASKTFNSRYLEGFWLYTTLEPCPMCTSAAIWAKMEGIVFGATKEDAQDFAKKLTGQKSTWRQIDISSRFVIEKGIPKVNLIEGFMRDECCKLFNFEEKI